ncbi:Protein LAZ1-like protein 2 [Hibiscus syriacus]|uniref:Protein LAZ1-like protein 2 n=1 Tax=Hibiscus syriacus TaxID=106335 RepID=A0A6A3D0G7_HIBSY|nr:Protein LAZ1-like protein 2 [Hibiscus syriacus]
MASGSSNVVLAYEDEYTDLHRPAVIIRGSFALAAVVLSLFLVLQHLRSYTNPAEQKCIVAIVVMVPVYATESVSLSSLFCVCVIGYWSSKSGSRFRHQLTGKIMSLGNTRFSLACDVLRSCYEAFAVYSFGSYLIACIGGERRVIQLLENESIKQLVKPLLEREEQQEEIHQKSFSNFFFRPSLIGKDLLTIENFGLVQYMILKTICALLILLLEVFGVYGDGEFKWFYGYFYDVTHERLRPIRPLAMFISFKAIVFATWWQVGIALLCAYGVLPKEGKVWTALQDFLICIEMAIAAVAHIFVFSTEHYHFLPVSENIKERETFHMKTDADEDHVESKLDVEEHVERHLPEDDSHSESHV